MSQGDMATIVREAAHSLSMLDDNGELSSLDSLAIIDLVVQLESTANVQIPPDALAPENFESIDAVARMLQGLGSAG